MKGFLSAIVVSLMLIPHALAQRGLDDVREDYDDEGAPMSLMSQADEETFQLAVYTLVILPLWAWFTWDMRFRVKVWPWICAATCVVGVIAGGSKGFSYVVFGWMVAGYPLYGLCAVLYERRDKRDAK